MNVKGTHISLLAAAGFVALLLASGPALAAAVAPSLGAAASYTVLGTNSTPTSGTVTCTTSTINGNVGTTASSITNTGPCTITGTIDAPVAGQVVTDFNTAYTNLDSQNPTCDAVLSSTPATMTLSPGVYCFTAGATMTSVIFTLNGPSTGIWVFKVGTGGTGSLTGSTFQVVMAGGGQACNVYWRTAQAATMTDSNFKGTILAGTAITLTRGDYVGRALAKTDVTVTNVAPMTFAGCAAAPTTLITQVTSSAVTLGAAISDTATLSGGAVPTGTITFKLYGPNDATCAGPVIFTSTVPVTGNGSYPSGSFTPTLAGTYRWIANYSGDANNAATANACNASNEIVTVAPVGVVVPTLTTQASAGVTLGAAISDTATLSGGLAPTGTIAFNLYGPNDATCTGPVIFTSTVPVTGNGSYPSGSFTPTLAGTYRWIATYSGDANNAGIATACNIVNENVIVAPVGAAFPTLTTQASAGVTLGAAISDTATLSGGLAPTGTITFKLYGPNDPTCTNAAIFTSTVPVSGNAVYTSGSFKPTLAGVYRWIANYSGDANNAATANACNAVNEIVTVAPVGAAIPTLTTQASPGVTLGAAISDTATLSGGLAPTGTITFKLYGPNDPTCTNAAIFTSTVPASGNGSYPSASFTPTLAGTYRWIVNYSGDANNAPTANACNAVNESVIVAAPVAAAAIPTLSEWAMITLAALLALFGVARIRRRAM
jgi:Ice-binding-like/IPTL-CTERM motif